MSQLRVILGVPQPVSSREFTCAVRMARALDREGIESTVLLSAFGAGEEPRDLSPLDVRIHRVPPHRSDVLADYWLEMIRFLEVRAPCLYLCSPGAPADWILPRLSSRIVVVPLLYRDDKATYEHCQLLGQQFNAVVPFDAALRQRLFSDFISLAPRISSLPDFFVEEEHEVDAAAAGTASAELARACVSIAERASNNARLGVFKRQRGSVRIPAELPPKLGSRRSIEDAAITVDYSPVWPDPVERPRADSSDSGKVSQPLSQLREMRIVVAVTSGRISGVDIFSVNLVRELGRLGYRAEILQTMPLDKTSDSLPMPSDVPVVDLPLPLYPTWPQRWAALRSYLEREPTIYFPNYDDKHSAIVPTLAAHVRSVAIGHSDDPQHYDHVLRLAPFCDAIVGVSSTIANHLVTLDAQIESRLSVIPYGVAVPVDFAGTNREDGAPLLAVFTGRLVQYQKRTFDLIGIAESVMAKGLNVEMTIAGSGAGSDVFGRFASSMLVSRRMRWVGSLANRDVVSLLRTSHVFLLPSSFEGLPLSLLEAMANGCVPIVTAIRSGVPELIEDGRNGFLVDVGDIAGFAAAIEKLSSDESLRRRMAGAAFDTVRARYTVERMSAQYIGALDQMLARPRRRRTGRLLPPKSISWIEAKMPPLPLSLRKILSAARERIR